MGTVVLLRSNMGRESSQVIVRSIGNLLGRTHRPGEGTRLGRGAENEAPRLYPKRFSRVPELAWLGATRQMGGKWNETERGSR